MNARPRRHRRSDDHAARSAGCRVAASRSSRASACCCSWRRCCYLVWRIVTPLWQPLLWAALLGALLAPLEQPGSPRGSAAARGSPARSRLLAVVLLLLLPVARASAARSRHRPRNCCSSIDTVRAAHARTSTCRNYRCWPRPLDWLESTAGIVARADRGLDGHAAPSACSSSWPRPAAPCSSARSARS